MTNFLQQAILALGMDPDGALVGAIGTIVATIGKVNGVTWKEGLFLILAGICLCGFIVPAIRETTDFGDGVILFAVFLLGTVSQHVYKTLDKTVPTLLTALVEGAKTWIKKLTK